MLSIGSITTQRIAWFVLLTLIHWIAIYPLDSVIQSLNNRALINEVMLKMFSFAGD